MEPQTVGHFVKLGWRPTVLRSSERGRGLCPCGGRDALWDPVSTLKPRVQKVMVRWGHLAWHKGSRDRAKSLSHPQGAPKLETICSETDWEEGQLSQKKVRCGRRKGRSGEWGDKEAGLYNISWWSLQDHMTKLVSL